MSFINFDHKILLFGLIILNFIIYSLSVLILKVVQKRIDFLHPGWIISACWFFYSQITPLYLIFGNINENTNPTFLRIFDFDTFLSVYIIYFIFLLILLVCDVTIYLITRNTAVRKINIMGINNSDMISLSISGFLFLIFGFIIYINQYKTYTQIDPSLIYDKTRRLNEGISGTLSFTNIYMISFLLLFPVVISTKSKMFKTIIMILFLFSSFLVVNMGTTLQVFLMIIACLVMMFKLDKNKFKKYVKVMIFIVPIFYLIVQLSEAYRVYKLGYSSSLVFDDVFNFSTFESVTGYISGMVVLKDGYLFNDFNDIDFFISLLPNFVRDLIGVPHETVTKIIDSSVFLSSYGTYVPTLPISLIPYWLAGICTFFLIYVGLFLFSYYLSKTRIIGQIINTLIFIDLFYLIRLNIESWAGKIRMDLALLVIAFSIYYIFKLIIEKTQRESEL